MKNYFPLILLALLALVRPAAAQEYVGDILPGSSVYLNTNLGQPAPTALSGSVEVGMTVDPAAPSASFDSVTTNNLQLADLVNTQYITTGFTTTDEITTDIHFNPINFSLETTSPSPIPLTPGTGSATPYYNFSTYGQIYTATTLALSGTYTVTSASETESGTFSVSIPNLNADALLGEYGYPELQTGGYPGSLIVNGYIPFAAFLTTSTPTALFSQSIDGSTVSPTFSGLDLYSANSVPLTEAPEPSASGYLLVMAGGFVLWRGLRVVRRLAVC